MAKLTEEDYIRLCGEEGIVPITVVMHHNEMPVVSWDNSGSGVDFSKFWCPVCLESYLNIEDRDKCKINHSDEDKANPRQMMR